MQAKELKKYLIEDTERLKTVLLNAHFHDIKELHHEIRCALPDGDNPTAVMIKLDETLYTALFELGYSGDLLGALSLVMKTDFRGVMLYINSILGLSYSKNIDNIDPLSQLRSLSKVGHSRRQSASNKVRDINCLNRFISGAPKSLVEEGISPEVIDQFSIGYDPWKERIIFPHFDWKQTDKVVGIKGRTIVDSETAKVLGIPKYWNYITGYSKNLNLYGYNLTQERLAETKQLIIFEGEKSVLKEYTYCHGKGSSVALGGHRLSPQQVSFILKNTPKDCEVVLAFDKDVMTKAEEGEDYIRQEAEKFCPFKTVSYIYDSHNLLKAKDAPVDQGYTTWNYLLRWRKRL